jgi:hypothetical protein
MKITIDLKTLSSEDKREFFKLKIPFTLGGAQKAKLTEERLRKTLNEGRPPTTDYDFNSGPGTFFGEQRVELKQLTLSNDKAQQVKPLLYDKILICLETKESSFWFVVNTSEISPKVSTKDNRYKEKGKLRLNGQHKGNLHEGMIQMDKNTKNFILGKTNNITPANNDEWSDLVTFIGKYPPLNYLKDDLGLTDQDILSILVFVRDY